MFFAHRRMRKQRVVLKRHADAALVRRHLVDVDPVEDDLTIGSRLKPSEHHQAGGFARAGRPQHGQKFPLPDK
jgi:hypothetical protein